MAWFNNVLRETHDYDRLTEKYILEMCVRDYANVHGDKTLTMESLLEKMREYHHMSSHEKEPLDRWT